MSKPANPSGNIFDGVITALANKHAQVDLIFNHTSLRVAGTGVGIQLDGSMSLLIETRDMTEEENKALASRHVSSLSENTREQNR